MWILYAFGSAFFAGLTAVLAKCGIEHTNSHLATALRTIVVHIFSWIMVGIVGSFSSISTITHKTFLFLILSGISTGASWLCYKFVAKNPHACVWDESHISLDKY